MLSASHNPAPDNGIKFFARGGLKLPDEVEDEIERRLATQTPGGGVPELGFGRVADASGERERYVDHLLSTLPESGGRAPLAGGRGGGDCAHGAAYDIAPRMPRPAGGAGVALGAGPAGANLNPG